MHRRNLLAAVAFGAVVLPLAAQASPSLSCTVPASPANLTAIPQNCQVTLTSGPVSFSNVVDSSGHLHDVTINILTATVGPGGTFHIAGTNFNQFSAITSAFSFFTDNSSSTTTDPGLGTFPFGVTDNYLFTSLNIGADFPAFNFPVSWDLQLEPGPPSTGSSTATNNGNGTYTITSFFDVFFELSLDDNLAIPHFTPQNGSGPTVAQITNIPEPLSLAIFGAALAGAAAMRRRRKSGA